MKSAAVYHVSPDTTDKALVLFAGSDAMVRADRHSLVPMLGGDMVLKEWSTWMTGPAAVWLTAAEAGIAATHGCVENMRPGAATRIDFICARPSPSTTPAAVDTYEVAGMRGFVCRGFLSDGVEHGVPQPLIDTPQQALASARRLILLALPPRDAPGGDRRPQRHV